MMRSEVLSVDFLNSAISWTTSLYSQNSHLFFVSLRNGDDATGTFSPNAATSRIATVVTDLQKLHMSQVDIRGWDGLVTSANRAVERVFRARPRDALPLRSFGVLPVFSTSLLVEMLLGHPRALQHQTIAVGARRLLREVYLLRKGQMSAHGDTLHPYLLYRMAKALGALKTSLSRATDADMNTFALNVKDNDLLRRIQAIEYSERIAESVYGVSDKDFRQFLEQMASSGSTAGWDACSQVLESLALTSVNATLARFSNVDKQRGDPSALLFALRILAMSDSKRHESLLNQGVQAAAAGCEYGTFPGNMPFLVDEKGRSTFVPSVETANALLAITMERLVTANDAQLDFVLDVTGTVEARLCDDYNTILLANPPGDSRQGWCSDKAPSFSRVDSWITVESVAFFYRRLALIRFATRRDILKSYSWVPYKKCKPSWEDVIDPSGPNAKFRVKEQIARVVDEPAASRESAPMFLLYGPPGTSKTTFVQAVAARKGWDLVTLSPSDFVEQSLDLIEQRSRRIFQDLMNLDRCVVLLDEMDSLMRDREAVARDGAGSILNFVVPALLPKLQQLRDYVLRREMAVFVTTNYYETIDSAIVRSGRLDHHIIVLPYDRSAQESILRKLMASHGAPSPGKRVKAIMAVLKKRPCNLVYRDLEHLSRLALKVSSPKQIEEVIESAAMRAGISPEYYRPTKRQNAYREVYAFLARLQNSSDISEELADVSEDDFYKYLRRSMAAFEPWPAWLALVEDWSSHINSSPLSS